MTKTDNETPTLAADPALQLDPELAAQLAAAGGYAAGDEMVFARIAAWRAAERVFMKADERDRGGHRMAEREFYRTDGLVLAAPARTLAGALAKLTIAMEDANLWELAAKRRDDQAQRMVGVWLDLVALGFEVGMPVWPPAHIAQFPAGRICSRMVRARGFLPGGASLPRNWQIDAADERWRLGETFHVAAFRWETSPTLIKAVSPTPPPGREILGRLVGGADAELLARN